MRMCLARVFNTIITRKITFFFKLLHFGSERAIFFPSQSFQKPKILYTYYLFHPFATIKVVGKVI